MARHLVMARSLGPRDWLVFAAVGAAVFLSGCSGSGPENSACEGQWQLVSFSSPTIEAQSEELEHLADQGQSVSLTLAHGGDLELISLEDTVAGSWSQSKDDVCRLDLGSQRIDATLSQDMLTLSDDEVRMVFERAS